jgi:hypothetical protein
MPGSAKYGDGLGPSGPQTVDSRRLTTSRPSVSAINIENSSAAFFCTGIGSTGVTGSAASSRKGTSSTPR